MEEDDVGIKSKGFWCLIMSKMDIETCFYCSEKGHSGSSCPELRTPLKEGFGREGFCDQNSLGQSYLL